MAQRSHTESCRPGDTLVVVRTFGLIVHGKSPLLTAAATDEFIARSPDELSLIERDDDFGDGWFLGKNAESGENGLFPEGR
jgi:hypothetical protein